MRLHFLLATLFGAILMAGCDWQAAPEPPPAPTVRVDTASVHYWGDRGLVSLRVEHLTSWASVRIDHPLCNRTLAKVFTPTDTTVTLEWEAARCPPSPYGYDWVQAILAREPGGVLATDTYEIPARYGSP